MSKAWALGSTPHWRALRLAILDRDLWRCGLCGEAIPRDLPRDHPMSAQVHHTRDRRLVGDDPRYLQASHRTCNLKAGQPGKTDGEHTAPDWLTARLARPTDPAKPDM